MAEREARSPWNGQVLMKARMWRECSGKRQEALENWKQSEKTIYKVIWESESSGWGMTSEFLLFVVTDMNRDKRLNIIKARGPQAEKLWLLQKLQVLRVRRGPVLASDSCRWNPRVLPSVALFGSAGNVLAPAMMACRGVVLLQVLRRVNFIPIVAPSCLFLLQTVIYS